jgi:transposase
MPSVPSPGKTRPPPILDFGYGWQAEGSVLWPTATAMKPIVLTAEQRRQIDRRRKGTLDRRVYQRLSAVLAVAADNSRREEVAELLGIGLTQLGEWLRVFRNKGIDALCTFHYKGDPGKLTPQQVERLKAEVGTGCFRNSDQIRHWIEETFSVTYSCSGVKDLLKRIGISYHKVTGFLWKADPDKQKAFVQKYERQKAKAHRKEAGHTRRYFVDACHPIWGLGLVFSCWLLVGQRFLVGMGSGRKRLNVLGAYCPDDQEYLDLRLTRDNINGEQFVNLLRLLKERHPATKRFILYLDNAAYYGKPVVLDWLKRHREFCLEPVPPYCPNVNLIERLWKFLKQKALSRWHPTFEAMQQAVSEVLDHLDDYQDELATLMVDEFHIIQKQEIPVQYQGVA